MPVLKRRRLAAPLGLAVILAVSVSIWLLRGPAPRYSVTDLGVLPGAAVSGASAINNRGDVVGLSGPVRISRRHAFLYRDGGMTDLGRCGLIGSHIGPTINDGGSVTGILQFGTQVSGPGQNRHAFLYDAGGMHDLGTPLGAPWSMGEGINSHGQITGDALMNRPMAGGYRHHAFLTGGGRTIDIGILPGCTDVTPTDINAAGQVVGYSERQSGVGLQAFVYDSRTRKMAALAMPPGFMGILAYGINDRGRIIGSALLSDVKTQAVLWTNSRVTVLGTLRGMESAEGAAINNRDEAVGTASSRFSSVSRFVNDHPIRLRPLLPLFQQSGVDHAFISRAGRMTDLNALIPAHSGWVLETAQGINDRGQIVGRGLHDGKTRAFLLTPR